MSDALRELQNIKQAIEQSFGVVNSYSQVLLEMARDAIQHNRTASVAASFQPEQALADIAKAKATGDTTSMKIASARLQSHKPKIGDDTPVAATTATATAAATTPVSNPAASATSTTTMKHS